jgi:hypothetical protein
MKGRSRRRFAGLEDVVRRNRVYVAIAELRTLGLRDVLVRSDDGYRIGSSVRVRREAE